MQQGSYAVLANRIALICAVKVISSQNYFDTPARRRDHRIGAVLHKLEQLAFAIPTMSKVHLLAGVLVDPGRACGVDPKILLGLLTDSCFQSVFIGQKRSSEARQSGIPPKSTQ